MNTRLLLPKQFVKNKGQFVIDKRNANHDFPNATNVNNFYDIIANLLFSNKVITTINDADYKDQANYQKLIAFMNSDRLKDDGKINLFNELHALEIALLSKGWNSRIIAYNDRAKQYLYVYPQMNFYYYYYVCGIALNQTSNESWAEFNDQVVEIIHNVNANLN